MGNRESVLEKASRKNKIIVLTITLIIISTLIVLIMGNTYTIKCVNKYNDAENVSISIEDENIVECLDKKVENGVLKIKIKSKTKGKTYINIKYKDNDFYEMNSIYVHKFGIITINEYLGDFNGSIVIPISIIIFLIYILYLLSISYKKSVKANMYQYKNIAYMGLIIFILFTILSQIMEIFRYRGILSTIDGILSTFSFALGLFPIVFIVSILVVISNISLIRKEGFNLRNVLGIFLGSFLCISTILPDYIYNLLNTATWIDIHNQNGMGVYIYDFTESIIHILITYIECVLIGTIIMSIKAAKHKPKFDKDFIVILGCQIKKDGTLTNLLKGRVDKAIDFSKMQKEKTGKDIIFVPSGGKGEDEVISEAVAMKNYLLEQGINEANILIEDNSKNTYENVKFSNKLIKEKMQNSKIAFSTTNYHVFRAGSIATEQKIYMEGIGAGTKQYFWINAFIREFIATMYSEKKKHLIVIGSMIFLIIIMLVIKYFNNML